ncbi:ABC transporter substrate-binding protein [Paenibacillus sp. FA6]|uniref:ABC transporter substrate-binding protein n=1 Tax=Paenibacillus sp. FA6 TaxID=3413029 RepID=UPI003F65703C
MKKRATMLLTVLMLLFVTACGNAANTKETQAATTGGDSKSTETAKKNVTLRIAWWGSDTRHEYTQKVIDMYKAKNPHVKIDFEYASFDDYWKKLAPQAAANQLPDIVQMDVSYISQYAKNGRLEDLSPYLNNQIQLADVSENVLSTGIIEGKQYGIPTGVNVLGYQYDPALLKKAGIDSIPADWDWDKYEELGLTAASNKLYIDNGMAPDIFFNYYLRTKGLTLYNPEGTALGYEDDALFVDYFDRLARMVKSGSAPDPGVVNQSKGIVEESDIVKEKGVGIWQWSNQFTGLQTVVNRPMDFAPMVGPDMDKGLYMQPSMYWAVTSNSKAKEEAAKFIDFWINDEEANQLIKGDRGVPISSKIKESLASDLSDQTKQVFEFVAAMEPKASPMSSPPPVGSPEIIAMLTDYAEEINFGQKTAAEVAPKFREAANAILANNK